MMIGVMKRGKRFYNVQSTIQYKAVDFCLVFQNFDTDFNQLKPRSVLLVFNGLQQEIDDCNKN